MQTQFWEEHTALWYHLPCHLFNRLGWLVLLLAVDPRKQSRRIKQPESCNENLVPFFWGPVGRNDLFLPSQIKHSRNPRWKLDFNCYQHLEHIKSASVESFARWREEPRGAGPRMVYMWYALVSDINLTDHTGSKPQALFGSWLQPWRPLCSSHIILFPVLMPGALFHLPSSLLRISGLSLLLLSWRSLGTTWMQPVCVVPSRGSPFVRVHSLPPLPPSPPPAHHILFLERIRHPVEILKTHKNLRTSKLWCNSNFISWALPSLVLFYKSDM